ncbi:recombinase RecT [Parapusillimonas sp. JC17]|uniref:recombinase RecT n=1 Tax=Parapusillimonas sp. JC17 TaxID=3445768 RepID=UPI003F9F16FF
MATNIANLRKETETAPAPRTILHYLQDDPRIEKGIAAVAGKFMTADRFLRLAVNAVKKTPLLMRCDPQSVLGAFMASAALGLEPNTIQQQAFLIPYKKRARVNGQWIETFDCQFQVGYRGFVTLAHRSPHIKSLQAEAVHDGDLFEHMIGTNSFLKYQKSLKDRGELIGAFSYVRLESDVEMAVVLPLDEILKIRSKSETYNALMRRIDQAEDQKDREKAERTLAETPWVMWEDDMAAKSAIKKHAKQLPLNSGDSLSSAAAIDNDAESNIIDMAAMADPDVARGVVQDGYAPPALEDNASPTVDMPIQHTEQREVIHVDSSAKAQASGSPARRQEQSSPAPDAEYLDADKVLASIQRANDHDTLSVAADSIQDCAPQRQEELTQAYRARLDALDSEPSRQRRRAPINAE